MKNIYIIILSLINLTFTNLNAKSNFNVFACEPEWALITKEIVKDKADISVGVYAKQNPHFIQAKPSLIANVKNANLVVCTGADLETGWLPMLLEKSGNQCVPVLYTYKFVDMLDKVDIDKIDRKNGDVHPFGNPHIHLNPYNMLKIAFAIKEELVKLDKDNANFYNQNYDIFVKNWNNSINKWSNEAKKLNGVKIVAHHKDFDYLAQWLKINIVAYLEEKPGVEPTAKYLASIVNNIDNQNIKLIIRAPYSSSSPSIWVNDRTNIKNIELPYSLDFNSQNNIFDLYNNILAILLANIG